VKRRAFLQLLAAAPIAALAPWRPLDPAAFTGGLVGVDFGAGDATSMWFIAWDEHGVRGFYPCYRQVEALAQELLAC